MDDTLASMISGPRARGAFVLRSVLNSPWSLRIEDQAALALVTMVRGEAWILRGPHAPAPVRTGDIAILRGPDPYTIADGPNTPPQTRILPGQACSAVGSGAAAGAVDTAARLWGQLQSDSAVMLSGTYQTRSEIGRPLLAALPPVLVRSAADEDQALIRLLSAEMGKNGPGQNLILDRILDLLFIKTIRAWLADPESGAPAWCSAQADAAVGPALRLMHQHPEVPWTVARLAAEANVSRATFARRFPDLMGEPPMMYLGSLRLSIAADLLLDEGMTVTAAARRVGYSSPFAFSSAFKRERGLSPRDHQRRFESAGSRAEQRADDNA